MAHDIYSYNQSGEEVSYIRFTMGDMNAALFYRLLGAEKYNAGVSGCGQYTTLSLHQMEKALDSFKELKEPEYVNVESMDFLKWQRNEMLKFIKNSLKTAQKEGKVEVYFG